MTRLDMVRTAVQQLGDHAIPAQMDAFIRDRFGEDIGVLYLPLIRATLRGEEELRKARERAALILAEERESAPKGKKKAG